MFAQGSHKRQLSVVPRLILSVCKRGELFLPPKKPGEDSLTPALMQHCCQKVGITEMNVFALKIVPFSCHRPSLPYLLTKWLKSWWKGPANSAREESCCIEMSLESTGFQTASIFNSHTSYSI